MCLKRGWYPKENRAFHKYVQEHFKTAFQKKI